MHCAGVVHGDLITSNILFCLSPHVTEWSDEEVYTHLGDPETEDVRTRDGKPPGPQASAVRIQMKLSGAPSVFLILFALRLSFSSNHRLRSVKESHQEWVIVPASRPSV
ncbi:hypothetical protein E1B28_000560 [Marasmius oreades]|uniref:Protein kinase domain-containing protein n=1 Tax=Marasmius oreades TaxID=181124 RepID=A0A9P7V1P5_9AGAR|nr:uncharacterized protein E1B28_000560 [Marasmius oreades]KAG7098644.1 hypothetical protein E1B28_000560 [Marasmius oreades]